jgi:hypothetical protein
MGGRWRRGAHAKMRRRARGADSHGWLGRKRAAIFVAVLAACALVAGPVAVPALSHNTSSTTGRQATRHGSHPAAVARRRGSARIAVCSSVLRHNTVARAPLRITAYCEQMLRRARSAKHVRRHRGHARARHVATSPSVGTSVTAGSPPSAPAGAQAAGTHSCPSTATTSGCVSRTLANLLPALTPAGTAQIKGTVTSAATTSPLEGVEVCAYDEAVFECVVTGGTGEYDITGLPAGSYAVFFGVPFELNANYLYQYYNNKHTAAEATPVVVSTGGTASGINAALQAGGQITGKVTDATTKTAVGGIEVCARQRSEEEFTERCAQTNGSGEYDVVGLPTGEYTVEFAQALESSLNYLREYYNGKTSFGEADAVAVAAGASTPSIDAAMHEGGRISGNVTDASTKAGIAKIEVCAFGGPEGASQCTASGPSGEYSIGGLKSGEYRVEFLPNFENESTLNYLAQFYNGKSSFSEAEPVLVKVGATTPNINAAMKSGGEISGKVTDATTKAAFAEVDVCASGNSGEFVNRCALTNASGEYTIPGLPTGQYTVAFSSFAGDYAPQYFNNKISFNEAQLVSVTAGAATTSINAAMQPGGEISGKVTDAATKAPVSGIEVCASGANANVSTNCVTTDASGNYALTRLAAAEYRVEFAPNFGAPQNYLRQYYNGKATFSEATLVPVSAGTATSEVNAALQPGGQITGTVTDAVTKASVSGIEVCAFQGTGEFVERCAQTNSSGEYDVIGLPTGSYTVFFNSGNGEYAIQYYNGKPQQSEATPVAVTAGATSSGISAGLIRAADITGTVTNAVTKAVAGEVEVCALQASSGAFEQCVNTASNGEYRLAGLAAGEYKVEFAVSSSSTTNFAAQYYNAKASFSEATVLTLAAGEEATSINAALHEAGKITGKVTDASTSAPVEGITVCAQSATGEFAGRCGFTNASGEYAITALNTGEYKVEFSANGRNYLQQYYSGKTTFAEGQIVSVTSGEATSGINAALQPGGKITGTVTGAVSKAPISGIEVCAFPKNGGSGGCAFTNASGEYSIVALTTAEYYVQFSGEGQNYIAQYYSGKSSFSEATALAVTAGTTRENINAALEVGAEITGTVTAAKTAEPLSNIEVEILTSTGGFVSDAFTNAKGEYTALGLPSGEDKVEFFAFKQEYNTQFYKGKEAFSEATVVTATAGGTITPNINAALLLAPPVEMSPPMIVGSAVEGAPLTIVHGSWKNQPTEFTYQWLRCNKEGGACSPISKETAQTYTPVLADVGHALRVEETAHNEGGASQPATSEATAPVVIAPPANTKAPSISGTSQQGKTLNVVAGVWTNEPTKFKYQWRRCNTKGEACESIETAKASSYVATAADIGHTLRVEETAENAAGPGPAATSAATEEVLPPIPVNTGVPTISGTVQQGQILTEHQGTWEYSPTEFKYQWEQCNKLGEGCLPISGANEQTYVPKSTDVGLTLRVEEFAKNAGGTSGPAVSAATVEVLPAPPVNISPPTISGTAQQGKEITEEHGSWENNPTSFRYEWLRCNKEGAECNVIAGEEAQTYNVTAADMGHTIRVAETAKNAGGTSEPATQSAPTAVVVPPAPVDKTPPTITGTPKQGKELTAHHGSWEFAPESFEDKWLRCNEAGETCESTGATGETYKLVTADIRHTMRVEEIATNEGGASIPATSVATGVVANATPEDETPPTITGAAQQGKELTLHHGAWSNEPTSYEDQWLRCNEAGEACGEISGATGEIYTPGEEDVGHTIRVEEKAHNEGGTSTAADSAQTAVVLPAAPVDLASPTITGEAVQGKTLTEHHGTYENAPTGYILHWLQCDSLGEGCLTISGAEGETYKPTALDVGHTIRVEEIATNGGGEAQPATSAQTEVVTSAAPANVTLPAVGGTPETNQTLLVEHGTWTNEPTSYGYQWLRCNNEGGECKPISGAVDPTFAPTSADVGATFEVQEVAINAGGESEPATSAPSAVVRPVALHAVAGEDVSTTEGITIDFDGSGSTPASEIEKYRWSFGDGTEEEGVHVSHKYAAGTYTATLTVTRGGENSSASVEVNVAAAPSHSATVEVTDPSHNPISGATVLYIGPSDHRIQATTGADGKASLAGLPAGTDTVYAYGSGFQPAVGKVTVTGEEGEATITLSSGEVAASTLKSRELKTTKEIEEAGINPKEEGNQNVYEFEVRLAFIESPVEPIGFHCYINSKGEFVGPCGGGCGCGGGGGWGGFGGGGGGGGTGGPSCSPHECVGGGIVAVPEVVDGRPLIQWLVLRGKASVLKQFFQVTQVVQNLSPEPFKLAQGKATLNIPPGMSLAPTATPQTATQTVAEVPGNGSAETSWIVRGDAPGEYLLSANYESQLEPFGAEAPVDIEARLATPLKVWGVEALELHVEAEEGFLAEGQPYRVHVSVTNKADIPLNNVDVEIFSNVHERFIFQPGQQFSETVAELKPGETVAAPLDILVPDDASQAEFNPALSSVHFVGEEIHPGVGIETLPKAPLYNLVVNDESASKRVHLAWQTDPNAEGYEVFSTPTLDTPFSGTPELVKADPNGSATTMLPANATEAYAPYNSGEPDKYFAVASVIHGKLTLDHPVVLSAFGSGAEDWGYCFTASGGIDYGVGPSATGTLCLVKSGDGGHAYLMHEGSASVTLQQPTNLNQLTTSLLHVANSCAAQAGFSVGAIAFEGPEDENPGRTYGAVTGSLSVDLPFTHVGATVEGALLQSRDLSTFGIYYGGGLSLGAGCAPSPISVSAEANYKMDSLELTGSLKDAGIQLLQTLQAQFGLIPPSPGFLLGLLHYIGPPLINLVKGKFDSLYEGLTGAATTPPTEPAGIKDWTLAPASSNNEVATATTPDQLVSASGRGLGVLGVGEYDTVPSGVPALQVGSSYFDTEMSQDSLFDPVSITDCEVSATDVPFWLNPADNSWHKVHPYVFDPNTGCVTITVGESSEPNIFQLTGTIFGISPEGTLPTNTKHPEITGKLEQGKKLFCSSGEWTGEPSFMYQWLRDGAKLASGTNQILRVASSDAGHTLSCVVVASNSAGTAEATSAGVLVPTLGCGDYWLNQEGGNWTAGANWSKGAPPASDEEACILANGTYEVKAPASAGPISVGALQLGGGEGTQTLTLSSTCAQAATLATSEGIKIGTHGSITLTDGESCPNGATLSGPVNNAGTLTVLTGHGGSRTVDGDVTNAHVLALGAGTQLQINGGYRQTPKASLDTAVSGPSSFGSVAVSGASDLEGRTLHLKQLEGFKASLGESFPIITSASLAGTLVKETGAQITPEGLYYAPRYTPTTLQLDVARASLTLSPSSGSPASTVTLHGSGYAPGDMIAPSFTSRATETEPAERTTYPAVATNAHGEFETEIVLPSSARPGKGNVTTKSHDTGVTVRQVFTVG